jgi:hypothetical protein
VGHSFDCASSVQMLHINKRIFCIVISVKLKGLATVVMVYFKVLPSHLPEMTDRKHENPVKIDSNMAKIQIRQTCQNCYHLNQLA